MVSFSKSSQEGSSRNAVEEPTGRDDMSSQEGSSRNAVEEPTGRGDIQKCPEQSSLRDEKFIQQISQKELSREMLEKSSGRVKTNHRDSLTGNLSMRGLFTVRLKPSVFRARSTMAFGSSRTICSVSIILAMFAVAQAAQIQRTTRENVWKFQKGLVGVDPDTLPSIEATDAFEGDWENYSKTSKNFQEPTSKANFTAVDGDMRLEGWFTLFTGKRIDPSRILIKNVQGTSVLFFEQAESPDYYWIVVPFDDSDNDDTYITLAWYSTLTPEKEPFYYTKQLKPLNPKVKPFIPNHKAEAAEPESRNGPASRMSKDFKLGTIESDDGRTTESDEEDNGSSPSPSTGAGNQPAPTQWFCHCPGDWVVSPVNASATRHKLETPRRRQLKNYTHSGKKHNKDPTAYIGTLRQGTEICEVCTDVIVCNDMPKVQWRSEKNRRSKHDYTIEIKSV